VGFSDVKEPAAHAYCTHGQRVFFILAPYPTRFVEEPPSLKQAG